MDLYIDTLSNLAEMGSFSARAAPDDDDYCSCDDDEVNSKRLEGLLVDAFTLKFPNQRCQLALDPNPDGCCAMKCSQCGENFCWFCFQASGTNSDGSYYTNVLCI